MFRNVVCLFFIFFCAHVSAIYVGEPIDESSIFIPQEANENTVILKAPSYSVTQLFIPSTVYQIMRTSFLGSLTLNPEATFYLVKEEDGQVLFFMTANSHDLSSGLVVPHLIFRVELPPIFSDWPLVFLRFMIPALLEWEFKTARPDIQRALLPLMSEIAPAINILRKRESETIKSLVDEILTTGLKKWTNKRAFELRFLSLIKEESRVLRDRAEDEVGVDGFEGTLFIDEINYESVFLEETNDETLVRELAVLKHKISSSMLDMERRSEVEKRYDIESPVVVKKDLMPSTPIYFEKYEKRRELPLLPAHTSHPLLPAHTSRPLLPRHTSRPLLSLGLLKKTDSSFAGSMIPPFMKALRRVK